MEWYWIFAFTVAAASFVGGLVWSILWRKKENRALLEALIWHEDELTASRISSRRLSEISEATTNQIRAGPSATPSASSCQSLPSVSSKDRLFQANNNEMEMNVLATPTFANDNAVDNNRDTPTDSDWRESSRLSASNTVDTDFTASASSRPPSASSGNTLNRDDGKELDNNWATPAVTFSDASKRGNWKVNRKSRLATDDDSKDAKYERIQTETYEAPRSAGSVTPTDRDPENDMILVPVQCSDDSDEEISFSTQM